MSLHLNLELHFYTEKIAAIAVTPNNLGRQQPFAEILMFVHLAIRQIYNMVPTHPFSRSLASALSSVQDPQRPLKLLLGPPQFSVVKSLLRAFSGPEQPDPLQNYVSVSTVTTVPYRGDRGTKGFSATVEFTSENDRFKLGPHDFDSLGRGVNYYAPLSVALLLRYLATAHASDATYTASLAVAARTCGLSVLHGDLASPMSEVQLPFAIARQSVPDNPL